MVRILAIALTAGMAGAPCGAGEVPDWREVSAIFFERCVMCHSAHGAGRGLRLDSYEATLAGGANGPVLVAGDAAGSELIRRLRGDSLPRMPFLSYPLTPEQIDVLARWVQGGARQ
jgi:mono/diheme cytochrome c family protein